MEKDKIVDTINETASVKSADKPQEDKHDYISIMTVNCRSIRNKMDSFRTTTEMYNPDIVVAVETWLSDEYTENEIEMDGYVVFRRDRNKHGGGIMVAIKQGANGTVIWRDDEAEMMGVKLTINGKQINLIAVYRPPNDPVDTFERLEERLSILKDKDNIIIAGDLNMPGVTWIEGYGRNGGMMQAIASGIINKGFVQTVREGTRKTGFGINNVLDVILVKPEELWCKTEVIDGISDHRIPITTLFIKANKIEEERQSKVWYYRKANVQEVKEEFKDKYTEWESVGEGDVEKMWNGFKAICNDIRDKYVPSKVLRANSDPVYYNRKVKKLKSLSRKLHNLKKHGACNKESLKIVRIQLNKEKAGAKNRFLGEMFNEKEPQEGWNKMYRYIGGLKGNGKKIHTLIDENGKECISDQQKADVLNAQYSGVFSNSDINEDDVLQGPMQKGEEIYITRAEVWRELRKLKNGKSPGSDGITNEIMKIAGREIIDYLVTLFNTTIRLGRIPEEWKTAIVVPIFKGGKRDQACNYRPVSLTSAVCKLLERILDIRMKELITEQNGLSDNQHGFRKEFSCETQLLGLERELAEALDEGGRVDAVFIDFAKAFDKVNHALIMEKLRLVVYNRELVNWVGDFLRNRVQKVRVNGILSEQVKVTSGVPQGSVLGPVLFNLFIGDIGNNIKTKIRLFADDCVLYKYIKTVGDTLSLQGDLDELERWVEINKMELNINKCNSMVFNRSRCKIKQSYQIGEKTLESVDSYKYLGVVFKDNLERKDQVERVSKKAIRNLNFVMRQLRGTQTQVKEKAYLTLIRPVLEYASSVWDPYKVGEIKSIEKVQRLAARRVTGRMRRWREESNDKGVVKRILERPSEIVKELGWKTLESRRRADRICNFYRCMKGNGGWRELNRCIKMDDGKNGMNLRKTNNINVFVKGNRKEIGKFSFLNRTTINWNSLKGIEIENVKIEEFRKLLNEGKFD